MRDKKSICNFCGMLRHDDLLIYNHEKDCAATIASRQMKAFESIAASLSRMIKEEYSDEPYTPVHIVGDGTGPDNWGRP